MFGFGKKKPPPPPEKEVFAPIAALPASGDQTFAVAMYRELAKAAPGNLFFSPYSISAALTMVQAGASGKTREELETALGFPGAGDALIESAGKLSRELAGRSEPTAHEKSLMAHALNPSAESFGCRLSLANAIWHQAGYPVAPSFVDGVRSRLNAEVLAVDFSKSPEDAVQRVNQWASDATRGRITDILTRDALHPLTRVILANAIYFKARWDKEFEEYFTKPEPFHLLDGTSVEAPLMNGGGMFASAQDPDAQVLQMEYTGGTIAMIVILPAPGKFEQVSKELSADRLEGWIGAMTSQQTELSMPKFRVESNFMLSGALKSLGIVKAFGAGDFSRISSEPGFSLAEVIHKTYVAVDEKGTEAAAVTMAAAAGCAPPRKVVQFRADRPFLFLIRDLPTKTTLFLGKVVDPRR